MKIISIEVFNLNSTGCHVCQPIPKGCLGVVVDRYKFDLYQELPGGVFFSECDGLLNIYKHSPGTTEGFAGRAIALAVMEPSVISKNIMARRVRVFKGSLWDSHIANKAVSEHLGTTLRSVGVRDLQDRYQVYSSAKATEQFISRLSKVIILGEAESSPLL
ncbi:hypothetical protein [Erwinia rhapontici]|uniref:hypothetical protein n=1 Tax=Erwinia rhapontici TaxID=55212 RepID=UPI0013313E3C|nr:hypothetical protein [Erwinia rhapontici]MBP2156907.1 hypothetical protein [Erwinia rhapontici]